MSKKFRKVFKQLKTPLSWALTLILVSQMFPAQGMAYAIEEATQALVPEVEEAVVYEDELLNEDVAIVEEAPVEETAVAEDEAAVAVEEAIAPEAEDAVEPAAEPEAEVEPAVDPEPADEAEPAVDAEPAVEPEAEVVPEEATEPEPEPAAEIAYPAQRLTATAGNMSVVVTAPEGALPEGSQLIASLIDTAYVADAVEAAVDAKGKTAEDMVAIDVTILDADGNEIQPLLPVSVKFANAGVSGSDIAVYHIDSETGAANEVDTATATSRVQSFEADGFSVYVVVEEGEDARLKVTFVKGDGTTETMMINQRQADTHIEQYIFDPGEGKIPEGSLFKGWTTEENYTASTEAKTIADVRNEVKATVDAGVTDGTEVTYYAMVFDPYTVTYLDERGIMVKIDQALVRLGEDPDPYEVSQNYTPYPAETEGVVAEFMGWQQLVPEVPGERVLYQPGDTFEFGSTKAYTLKAFTQEGHWLSFDENLSNATYTEPQFVAIGEQPSTPTAPTRTGYTFDGWYTEDASSERDGQVSGSAFDFNAALTANTTVYAKWNQATRANYNVVIWLQNVEGDGYDYSGTTVAVSNATVGNNTFSVSAQGNGNDRYARVYTSNTNYNNLDDFTGFHLSTTAGTSGNGYDSPKSVAAEGNTVINVYYDRNEYTLTFQTANGTTVKQITALYGQSISDQFPIVGSNGTTYPTGTRWNPQSTLTVDGVTYFTRDVVVAYVDIMTPGNMTFRYSSNPTGQGYANRKMVYWIETLNGTPSSPDVKTKNYNGTLYEERKEVNAVYYGVTQEDYFDIPGFTKAGADKYFRDGYYRDTNSNNGTRSSEVNFYYSREKYEITYSDGVFVNGGGAPVEDAIKRTNFHTENDIFYEAAIADKNIAPELEGFVFLGWYDNEICAGDTYAFGKMPDHNVTLYAKWGLAEYEVNLHANDSADDPIRYSSATQATTFYEDNGGKVGNVGGERNYYDLVGWYSDEAMKHPFDFDSFVLNETMVGKYGKLYTESEIDPEYPTTIGEMNLYAKWRSKLIGADGIVVEYNANGGAGAPKDENKYVDLAEAIAQGASTPKDSENYVFSHWAVQKWNGSEYVDSGVSVYPGDTFEVLAANAKITDAEGNPVAVSELKDGETYTYTVQLKAEYIEKDKALTTFINWYDNYSGALLYQSKDLKINQATPIPDAPTRAGYKFLGWIRGVEEAEASTTTSTGITTLTDLFITWNETDGYSAEQVAPDENFVNDNAEVGTGEAYKYHHAMFAKWEAVDVDYTVEFYYQNADGSYTKDESLTATRQAETDTIAEATTRDKAQTKDNKYKLNEEESTLSATVKGDGTTVLSVYFDLNKVDVTVEHYLKGETTAFKTDTVKDQTVGDSFTPTPETKYQEKNLAVDSYSPTQTITVATEGNLVKIYYTLPLTITAKTDSKTYNGAPLAGEYTIEGALSADEAAIKTALGEAPSITNVSESPKDYLTEAEQAEIAGIPAYYVVTYTSGTLTINPKAVTITAKDASKAYDGDPLTQPEFSASALEEGDTHTFTVTMTEASTITNVGTQPNVIATVDGTAVNTGEQKAIGNYLVTTVDGKLTITQNATAIRITSPDDSKMYDGTELHKAEYTVMYGETKLEAAADGSFTLPTGDKLTITDTSKVKNVKDTAEKNNTFTYVLANADQYSNVTTTFGTLTITPRSITMTSATDTKKYDGKALTNDEVKVTGDGFVEDEGATYTVTGTQTEVGSSDNSFTYKLNDGTDADNYTITTVAGKLTVTKTDKVVTITSGSETWKYDGEEHSKPVYTVKYGDETATADESGLVFTLSTGDTVTISKPASVKDVKDTADNNNTYEYVLTNAGQYETVTATYGTLTITPRTVTLTSASGNKQYDGTPLVKNAQTDVTVSGEGFVEGEGATYTITGTQTEVGKSKNAFTYTLTGGATEGEKGNYTITKVEGDLEVTKNAAELTIASGDNSWKYDGEDHSEPTYTITFGEETGTATKAADGTYTYELSTGDTITISKTATVKNVSDTAAENNTFEYVLTNADQYENVTATFGKLEITPRTVTLTSASDEKVYDGTPLVKNAQTDVTVGGDKFVEGEGATYTITGTQTEVGESKNAFTYKLNDGTLEGNYTITTTEGTLKVTELTDKVTVTITEHKGSETYDGTEKTVTGYDVTSISNELYKEADFTFSGNATVKGTDAGSYPMELKAADFTNTNKNFSNVEFVIVDGTLEITPRTVTLTSESDSKVYDGTALTKPEVTVGGDGFVAGEVTDIKATGTITEVGTVDNTITYTEGAAFKADNYDITKTEGKLTITAVTDKVTVTITEHKGSETYDGTEKTVAGYDVTSISNELYKETDFTFSGNATVKGTDAGSYPMELKSADFTNTNENFTNVEFVIIDGTLEIAKRKVTLTSATDSKQYDGTPLTNDKVSAEGFVDGEGATYDVTGSQTLVGSSENTFTYTLNEGTKAANYDITTVPGTLTVTNRDAKYEITVEANSTEATYDGKEHAATGVKTLEFEVEGNKYTVSGLTTSDPKSTDACEMPNNITGTAVVKDAAGNDVTEQFAVSTKNGTLKINPLEVTIKSGDAEKQYDGKALTSDEITYPKPFVEGEGVIITMTGSQTLVGQSDNTFTYELRDNTKAANYTITTEFGTLKVTDRTNPFEVTVVSNSDEVTYDGNEHKVEGFETLEFTIDGVKFTVSGLTAEGKGTDAGEYPDTISGTAVVKDADGNDVTAQFTVNQTEGKLVIKPVTDKVTVTITEHSGEFVFDNTEKTVEGYDVTSISNPLYKDTDFAFSGDATVKGTNAGTYDMELKPADFSNTSKNFTDVEFVIVDGQLVITPKHIDDPDDPGNPSKDLTVTGPEDTVYNGLEQKQPVQVTDKETGQVLVEGIDFELTYGDDMVNVGEVPVTVKGIGNYEGTFNLSYKITPAPLKIETGSAEKVYDATPLTSDECEVEGLVNGETLRVDPDGSQTLVGSSDNTVTITWADDVIDHYPLLGARILSTVENPTAKKSNYEVEVTLGTLTVTDDGVPTDLVVTKTHEGEEFGLGETITFTLTATNIYDEERDITFVEIEGVEVAQATFEKVPAGETVETTATYTVTEADILAGEFKNQVTVKIGDAEHGPAEDIVVIEEKNPHLTVTKTVTSAAETYAVGETIEYKIVVENDGNLTISDIKVTDELTGDEWTIEQLAPGEKQEFTAKYTVTEADAAAGKVVNTATATGKDPEGNDPSVTPGTTETPVKKPELPKTGDTSGLVSAAASASMGLMSLAGWLHTLRRRKEDDEQ